MNMTSTSYSTRINAKNSQPVVEGGQFVLYWMLAQRRVVDNFGLERAIEWAKKLDRPLLILESLTLVYEYASPRQHIFLLQGMADNAARLHGKPVTYYPFVERIPGERADLLVALASLACVVIVDDFPMAMHRELVRDAAEEFPCRLEAVDSCGLLPLRSTDITFPTAFAFRRYLQRNLHEHLDTQPLADPLRSVKLPAVRLPEQLLATWPSAQPKRLLAERGWIGDLPLLHDITPIETCGGTTAAERVLDTFLGKRLTRYADERNEPDSEWTSSLSPYLHFGHISVHRVFRELAKQEAWSLHKLSESVAGKKEGWWGMSRNAESFLDELITWREIGYNFNHLREDYKVFSSLPPWAIKTLNEHRRDRRAYTYTQAEFEQAGTHDPLWNAAQMQLRREGRIHNYLRMLWGKKILEWSASPEDALAALIEINDKWAIDGRDPNSYSGILWCLGRYDRPWFPERQIFGQVRYMSSANTARKVNVKSYIERYSGDTLL